MRFVDGHFELALDFATVLDDDATVYDNTQDVYTWSDRDLELSVENVGDTEVHLTWTTGDTNLVVKCVLDIAVIECS